MEGESHLHRQLSWTGERVIPDVPELESLYQFHWVRYSFAVSCMRGGRVLDLGCGAGYGANLLATVDPTSYVVGMDISTEATTYASSQYQLPNLQYTVGNVLTPPFYAGSFDLVVSFEVFEHIEGAERSLAKIRSLLRPEGIFILSTPNRDVYSAGCKEPWNPYHVQEYSLPEFAALLRSHFPCVEMYGQSHSIGSLIWRGEALPDIAVRQDLTQDLPLSSAPYLIALCSTVPLPEQLSQLWLMDVRDLEDAIEIRQQQQERLGIEQKRLGVEIKRLNRELKDLHAYRERVESHWAVRALRRLQRIASRFTNPSPQG